MPGIYNFCWYFLIFSFVGWMLESALVSFQQKKFVNRGFLTGPICPIYGTAMCIIIAALTPVKLLLFRGGAPTAPAGAPAASRGFPSIRAQPCFCLCLGFSQMIITRPLRLMILHFSHMGLTEGLTFMVVASLLR